MVRIPGYKLASRLIETCEKELDAKSKGDWNRRDMIRAFRFSDKT